MDINAIDIITYNLKSSAWWNDQTAIVTKKYQSISGEVIDKEATVTILYSMQRIRFGQVIHQGSFFVQDLKTGVQIGGIHCSDLVLIKK